MQLIKLDATESTNLYLKQLALESNPLDYTVVSTQNQTSGRGQMGTKWISEEGKNLTFSILKKFEKFNASEQVLLNCSVSLAVYKTLEQLSVPDLTIKWPNDIMSGNQKICGILIENMLQGDYLAKAIIGIGLNVNQTNFGSLKKVSSLQLLLHKPFHLEDILQDLVKNVKNTIEKLPFTKWEALKQEYEQVLFRKDKPSTFKDEGGTVFMGFIRKINAEGQLVVELEDQVFKAFSIKEISLMY